MTTRLFSASDFARRGRRMLAGSIDMVRHLDTRSTDVPSRLPAVAGGRAPAFREDIKDSMVRFVLIRPGSTDFDEQGRIQGTLNIPLSARGVATATRIAAELQGQGLSTLYSAPCQSAWQTASLIGKSLGLKPKKLDKLRNINHGLWQGMLIDEVKHKQPTVYRQWQETPSIVCPPEGEMLAEAQERVEAAFAKLLRKHREGVVGLVVREPLASLVRGWLTRAAVGNLWNCCASTGAWELVPYEPDEGSLGRDSGDSSAAGCWPTREVALRTPVERGPNAFCPVKSFFIVGCVECSGLAPPNFGAPR